MVKANSMSNVPIESKLMRCSMANNPANKPESIENNKQAPVCHRRLRCLRWWWWLLPLYLVSFGNCCRISCCKWLKPNFPNNLNVESSASVDSIVCKTRCSACNIAYKLQRQRESKKKYFIPETKHIFERKHCTKRRTYKNSEPISLSAKDCS